VAAAALSSSATARRSEAGLSTSVSDSELQHPARSSLVAEEAEVAIAGSHGHFELGGEVGAAEGLADP
jgi:hypothetical protein